MAQLHPVAFDNMSAKENGRARVVSRDFGGGQLPLLFDRLRWRQAILAV
jgi:hypothetical protein